MQIGINDLDDDDFGMGFTPSNQEVQNPEEPKNQEPPIQKPPVNEDNDFMSDFLKTRGIEDISKIKFEDDNGNIEEKDWNSLTKEEKFNILNTPLTVEDNTHNELSDEELNLLNQIRESNLTPTEFIKQLQEQQDHQEPQYKIDDLSDDELYLLDLESRVGELSDDIAAQALNNAKQNEELFKKQIEGIRKEYKEREDYQLQQEQAEIEQQQQEAYNNFQDSVITSINGFNSIGNLDLNFDDSDKEELAQFMLSRDEAGNNYLWQALQDPDTLVKAAWFILNGDEALNNISDYFINQIKLVSENQYKKGFEEGKNGKQPSRPQVVINKQPQNHQKSYNSIEDLDDDE